VFSQDKIFIDNKEENAFFNTCLLSVQGEEIFGHFTKSLFYNPNESNSNYWYFKAFLKSNDRELLNNCPNYPEIATYFDNFNELYFNVSLTIEINYDHIYDDNFDRLPDDLKTLDKETTRHVFNGFRKLTKKKLKETIEFQFLSFIETK
jgi:hypothetical protein